MAWRKLGMVYRPSGELPWARSNAIFPTADLIAPDRLRVYITSLDENMFGQGGYVDVDPDDPLRVLEVAQEPILKLGDIGDFDDAGANPFAVVQFGGRRLMYYQGWQRTLRAPMQIFTGLAIEQPDGSFAKWARVPVLERTAQEPHIRGAPCLIADGDRLLLWYVASDRWVERRGQLVYDVVIRHAVSSDGVNWQVKPHVCLKPEGEEYAVGRPWVIRDGDSYRMWYSIRSLAEPYRIGYAESADGVHWTRKDDEAGISRSVQGWDSEMVCFPNVVRVKDRLLLFYNGNRHGVSGFGCAEWRGGAAQ